MNPRNWKQIAPPAYKIKKLKYHNSRKWKCRKFKHNFILLYIKYHISHFQTNHVLQEPKPKRLMRYPGDLKEAVYSPRTSRVQHLQVKNSGAARKSSTTTTKGSKANQAHRNVERTNEGFKKKVLIA